MVRLGVVRRDDEGALAFGNTGSRHRLVDGIDPAIRVYLALDFGVRDEDGWQEGAAYNKSLAVLVRYWRVVLRRGLPQGWLGDL